MGASLNIALMLESDGPGGAESMLLHMAEELRARGHAVCPVGPSDGCGWLADQFRSRGFEPELFTNTRMFDRACVDGLVEMIKRRRIEVVHSHEFGMAVYGTAACRRSHRPHIITMHGGKYYETRLRRRLALRWAITRSRAGVAVSDATRAHVAQSLWLRNSRRLRVIPNGIRYETGNRQPVRQELGVGDGELLIVAIGNLYPVKGHAVLLEALARLPGPKTRWRLAIAGRGGEEPHLRGLAAELGIADRIQLLGFRDDVADILAAGDVYVMPSLSEGMPVALLEAMFSRLPIIASKVGGIPEVVEDGRSAILSPPGDVSSLSEALERLLGDVELRRDLAAAAHQRASDRYSVAAMVDAYEVLYRTTG